MTSTNVPQAMIDAYYEYTHLTLDRRAFVTKLRALAEPDAGVRAPDTFEYSPSVRAGAEVKLPQ